MDRVRAGRAARGAAKWADAEIAYEGALTAADAATLTEAQRAEILGELGLAELALQKYVEAAEHLWASLSKEETLRGSFQRRFEAGRKQADAQVVRLYLGVKPPDAEVFLDGKPLPGTGSVRRVFAAPGRHTVRARLTGHSDIIDHFDAGKGETRTLRLELSRVVPPSQPAARPQPEAPAHTPSPLADKVRTAALVASGAAVVAGTTALVVGAAVHGDLVEQSEKLRNEGWGSDACRYPDGPKACSELGDAVDLRNGLAAFGLASLASGIAIGVVTAGSYWVAYGPSPRPRDGVRVAPLATGHAAGLMIDGLW